MAMRGARRRAWGLVVCLALSCAQAAGVPSEYAVKAAYLFNFTRFIEWPARAFAGVDSPIAVCVLGRDPFGDNLDALEGKTAHGRMLRIDRDARPEEPCQVVFISRSEAGDVQALLEGLAPRAALTVSDIDGFARAGGMIELTEAGQRIHFEINLAAGRRAGLTFSSKLLSLARSVIE